MPDSKNKRILILTAGFGEGHNSAAKNLYAELEKNCSCKVVDPVEQGAPWVSDKLQQAYRYITTRHPMLWKRIYLSTDQQDFSKQRFPLMRRAENWLAKEIMEFQPHGIVSTYPLYPYFLKRIFEKHSYGAPVFTVITDSYEINSAWSKAPSDHFIVTDAQTRLSMLKQGIPTEKVHALGFPVHPRFSFLTGIEATANITPFKVLYFPTPKKPVVRRILRAILEAHDSIHVTIVLGKNVRLLYKRTKDIKDLYPERITIKGWTKKVPELLNNHHLIIGKAGGATVHESLAATCPMLVHHLVPGQEEGNLDLLRFIGGGDYVKDEEALKETLQKILHDNGQMWRDMKNKLTIASRPDSSKTISNFILQNTI